MTATTKATKSPVTIRAGVVRLEAPVVWECGLCWAKGGCQTRAAAQLRADEHVAHTHPPCIDCGRRVNINGDCPRGCELERMPDPPLPVTSRNRFGGRNR